MSPDAASPLRATRLGVHNRPVPITSVVGKTSGRGFCRPQTGDAPRQNVASVPSAPL